MPDTPPPKPELSRSEPPKSEAPKLEAQRRDPDKNAAAEEALEAARSMPPGPERTAALKKAGLLRHALGLAAIVIPRKGRPPK